MTPSNPVPEPHGDAVEAAVNTFVDALQAIIDRRGEPEEAFAAILAAASAYRDALILAATAHGRAQNLTRALVAECNLDACQKRYEADKEQWRLACLAERQRAEAQLAEQDAEIQRLRALTEPHG